MRNLQFVHMPFMIDTGRSRAAHYCSINITEDIDSDEDICNIRRGQYSVSDLRLSSFRVVYSEDYPLIGSVHFFWPVPFCFLPHCALFLSNCALPPPPANTTTKPTKHEPYPKCVQFTQLIALMEHFWSLHANSNHWSWTGAITVSRTQHRPRQQWLVAWNQTVPSVVCCTMGSAA